MCLLVWIVLYLPFLTSNLHSFVWNVLIAWGDPGNHIEIPLACVAGVFCCVFSSVVRKVRDSAAWTKEIGDVCMHAMRKLNWGQKGNNGGGGKGRRQCSPHLLSYHFLFDPRFSFRTAESLSSWTIKEKTHPPKMPVMQAKTPLMRCGMI